MAVNIQRGRPISRASVGSPRSPSSSLTTSSNLFDVDYVERVAMQNNMDVDETTAQGAESIQPPTVALAHPRASSEAAPISTMEPDPLSQPSPPDVIPYEANVPVDPSLWDGNFGVTSLFGTNGFL